MAAKLKQIVHIKHLGLTSYSRALAAQQELQRQHLDFLKAPQLIKPNNNIILCEHYPVYTLGKRRQSVIEKDIERLKLSGADFHLTHRGGLITFHGPGQLVCYPILNLGDFKKSVRWYVCSLEETLIRTCEKFGISAKRTSDTGVWVGDNKIAAIGVQTNRWITMHGIALNCNTNLSWFENIVPCGIEGKGVTSLSVETERTVTIEDTMGVLLRSFEEVFDCTVMGEQMDYLDDYAPVK